VAVDGLDQARRHAGRRPVGKLGECGSKTLMTKLLVDAVVGLIDPIGVEDHGIAGLELHRDLFVDPIGEQAERGALDNDRITTPLRLSKTSMSGFALFSGNWIRPMPTKITMITTCNMLRLLEAEEKKLSGIMSTNTSSGPRSRVACAAVSRCSASPE
jgi:hypothetical protein